MCFCSGCDFVIKESVFCQGCGSEVPVDSDICPNCGNSMKTVLESYEHHDVPAEALIEKDKKKKRIQIIISVVAVVVTLASLAIKIFIVDKETPEEKAVNDFIGCVDSYKTGVCKDNSYSSEFFGIRINFDNNWEVSAKNLDTLNAEILKSLKITQAEEMRIEGYEEKLIKKVVDNSYAKVELQATTLNYGGAEIRVCSNFGISSRNMHEVVAKTKKSLTRKGIETTLSTTTICGEKYYVLKCTIQSDKVSSTINELYMRAEGDMLITMSCYYQQGYEEIRDNFINSISKY